MASLEEKIEEARKEYEELRLQRLHIAAEPVSEEGGRVAVGH